MDFDDILDGIIDLPSTILDLPSMAGDFLGSTFENISEFSVTGLVFAIISVGTVLLLSKWLLNPFLSYMNGIEKIFWMIATYIACAVAGYFLGNYFENS